MPAVSGARSWAELKRRAGRPRLRAAVALPAAAALAGAFVLAGPLTTASATTAVSDTHPAWATASADRGAVSSGATVATTVYLAGRNPVGMAAYATAVSTPSSSSYHRYLTTSQFNAAYGATPAQVAAVEAWLKGDGLSVTSVTQHTITASGSAAATEKAYGTGLHNYTVKGHSYRAPVDNARVPANVASAVLTVTGLDNMPVAATPDSLLGEVTTSVAKSANGEPATASKGADGSVFLGPTPCSSYYGQKIDTSDPAFNGSSSNPYAVCGYVPSQLRGAYGVSASGLSGKGVTVAIVDAYGSPTMLADADQYAVNHGDKAFRAGQYAESVTPSQWTNEAACQEPSGWAGEETLDVEAVHSMAPAADIHYFGANSCFDQDFLDVFETIDDTHAADIVSDSWGGVVYSTTGNEDPSVMAEYTSLFEQGAIEGISYQFSTGDCGAEDPATGCGANDTSSTPQADFPDSDPWVTAVGGTSLAIGKHNQQEWNTYWGTDIWLGDPSTPTWDALGWYFGGGGGTSAYYSQPWYQRGTVPHSVSTALPDGTATASPMRVVPDVSMDADPYTGFLVGQTQLLPDKSTGYAESDVGGTSLASPLFAGLEADAVQAQHGIPVGFADPAIYARYGSFAFNDVTGSGPGTHAANMLPPFNGYSALAVTFGNTDLLHTTRGYDDSTGVGTASPLYLLSHELW